MQEVWRPVVGYEGLYEVSDLGVVRSVTYVRKYRNSRRIGRVIRHAVNHRGYIVVRLCRDAVERSLMVHRLVLESFVGVRPDGLECRHFDGDKTNNALLNLSWGTSKENTADRIRHGTLSHGERSGRAVISDAVACEIKRRVTAGEKCARVAREYGVSRGLVSHIKHGRRRTELGVVGR